MDKQIIIYPHNGVLLSSKKERRVKIPKSGAKSSVKLSVKKQPRERESYQTNPFV